MPNGPGVTPGPGGQRGPAAARSLRACPVIDELTSERGLDTSEIIPAMRASAGDRRRGETRLATHHLPDAPDPDGD